MVDTVFFYVFALMVLGGGILTITRRNAVHAALSLIVALLGVAGIYLLQQAEFLFAVQIILYIGGVVLLMLFVIMLINLDQTVKMKPRRRWPRAIPSGWPTCFSPSTCCRSRSLRFCCW